jgi:unsaturated chondroitin disaccharide hydrolase
MNLPLLFWASEQTGNSYYKEAAIRHLLPQTNTASRRWFQLSYLPFDAENGKALRGSTAQGSSDSSCWSRGQAWGIYGLALAFKYIHDPSLLDFAAKLSNYFLNRLPDDWVCYWDLSFTEGEEEARFFCRRDCSLRPSGTGEKFTSD